MYYIQNLRKVHVIVSIAIMLILLQGVMLFLLGQPVICECGYIKIWEGVVLSPGNSQHIADWCSFSHIIHGLVFYVILWILFPNMPVRYRFLLALGIEAGWEVIENTPWIINIYRQQALAQGYIGDSILNSIFDTLFAVLGFGFARFMPLWTSITIIVALEVWVGYFIHDNLTLNILNFIHQFEFIQRWQAS